MRRQLRRFYNDDELSRVYPRTYDHHRWPDHVLRINFTIHLARWMAHEWGAKSVTDLSCGDGAIARGIGLEQVVFGDYVSASHVNLVGPIEENVKKIEHTDLFILSETLEHVKRPDALLSDIRPKAATLIVTTPLDEQGDGNPEHYWGWDQDDVGEMLREAGWTPAVTLLYDPACGYTFQMWGCF